MSRVVAAAFALVALSASETFAQAEFTPTLTVTATGNSVEIRWTPISIAPTYELQAASAPGAADIVSVTLPAALLGSAPRIVVTAPNGQYYLRVRAAAGAIKGPWSNEVALSVGLQPCVPGAVPTVAVTVDQNNATVTWTGVPGATAYVVQWSRFTGGTELAETVTATSVTRQIPMNGTFYVRVVAVTACGNQPSAEATFTVAVVRRHLSAGEILSHLQATRNNYPNAFFNAHRGGPESWDFIILACRRLYSASGGTVGCNFRRAVINDVSMDGLSVENPSDGRYYFADVIAGAGGPNPTLWYEHPFHDGALLRNDSGNYAPWGFANPFGVPGSYAPLRTYVNYGPAGGW
jgi:hypothetical protein